MMDLLAVVVFLVVLCLAIANAKAGQQKQRPTGPHLREMRDVADRQSADLYRRDPRESEALDDLASRCIVAFGHSPSAKALIEQDWRRAGMLGDAQTEQDRMDIREATS